MANKSKAYTAMRSGGERILVGERIHGHTAPIKEIIKQGEKRIITLVNGTRRIVSRTQLGAMVQATLAEKQRKDMETTIRPKKSGKGVTVKIGGFLKGVERAAKSRAHAVKMLDEVYGKGQTRGTRFSKASRFGAAREAVRANINREPTNQNRPTFNTR